MTVLYSLFSRQERLAWLFMALLAMLLPTLAVMTKPSITIDGALLALVSALSLIHAGLVREAVPKLVGMACLGTLLFIGMSCFLGVGTEYAREHLPRWLIMFPLGLAMIGFAGHGVIPQLDRQWRWVLAGFIVAILYVAFSELTQYRFQFMADVRHEFAPTDFNKTLVALVMVTPAILYPFWVQGGRSRTSAIIVGLMLIAVTIPSYAQSAVLGLMVILLSCIMPVKSRRFWRLVRVVTIIGMIGLPYVMPFAFHQGAELLRKTSIGRTSSAAERLEIWSAVSDEIQKQPIFGHGYNAGRVIEFTTIQKKYYWDEMITHTHNFVLHIWLEFGLVGILPSVVFLVLLWRKIQSVQDLRIRRMYFMTTSTTIAIGLVGWSMWQTWWMTMMFILATINILAARLVIVTPKDTGKSANIAQA